MSETIDYDKHVTDLIAALSKTGHVTHTRYKKTSVTFHHNGGNLTHNGVLSVWKTRPASAHFDVDARGDVAQYVQVQEYAWAVGNRGGNESTISIEMADKTFAPHWEVGDDTWKSAARLAGWLFANVIKATPTKNNVHYHHDWSATECPGPYMDSIRTEVLAEVQKWYAHFSEDDSTPSSPHPTTPDKKSVAEVAKEVIAGKWGNGDTRTSKLKAAGYDPKAVQAEVNKQLGHTGGKKSVHTLALEVIGGNWGSGDERKSRLTKAGYDYAAVQKEVNRLLG
jgi:N-acetyl-anhydromuramyl-L-alanine amidase AmpD